jgi:hypothetical protein
MDDGDVSQPHSRRKSAGDEALTRRLREVVYDTLPRAQLLVVILFQQGKSCLTHPSLVVDIIVNSSAVGLLKGVMLLMLDRRSR